MPTSISSQAEAARQRTILRQARASIAAGERSVDATIDLWWEQDARPEMPLVAGTLAIAQRLYRRLATPRGFFRRWPNEGLGIQRYLNAKPPLWVVKNDVEAECARDQQVLDVVCTPQLLDGGKLLAIDVFFTTTNGEAATLTLTATEAATTFISLSTADR